MKLSCRARGMPVLSVVVPVYRNAPQLAALYERIAAATALLEGIETEFVFVDDASPDESFAIVRGLSEKDRRVRAVRLSRNFGSNAAILAGFFHTRGDATISIAADLQDPPELIPKMVAAWRKGAQVVLAARADRDDPLVSRLFSAIFNRLFRLLAFAEFPKDGFDFILVDRQVADALRAMPEKNSYLFGQVMWVGFRRTVLFYSRAAREEGRSGWTFSRKVKYFIDAFTAFSYVPIRAASALGFLLAGLGFLYAVVVATLRVLGFLSAPPGYTALMCAIAVTAGAQLVVTGLLGEYLWRVLEEVRPRPPFVVAERLNMPVDTSLPGPSVGSAGYRGHER